MYAQDRAETLALIRHTFPYLKEVLCVHERASLFFEPWISTWNTDKDAYQLKHGGISFFLAADSLNFLKARYMKQTNKKRPLWAFGNFTSCPPGSSGVSCSSPSVSDS